jgi:hypothetical protein
VARNKTLFACVRAGLSRAVLPIVLIVAYPWSARAVVLTAMHARMGMLVAEKNGYTSQVPATLNFNTLDLEYEVFTANKRSVAFRFTVAPDLTKNKVHYTYAGIGQRFYIDTKGMMVDEAEHDLSVTSLPRWRFSVGWDLGLSEITVTSVTSVLDIVASLYDLGVSSSLSYRLTDRLNLEGNLGASFGYGFSSVSVNVLIYRGTVGVNYFF